MPGGHRHAVFRDEKTGNGTDENGTSPFPFHQHADLVYKQLRTVVLLRANGEVSVFVFTLLVHFDSDYPSSTKISFARALVQTTVFINRVVRPGGVCVGNAMKSLLIQDPCRLKRTPKTAVASVVACFVRNTCRLVPPKKKKNTRYNGQALR